MKKLYMNLKQGELRIRIENPDDLWILSQVIDPGDIIKGKTERKIKLGKESEKAKVLKKTVFIAIAAEKIEFNEDNLRINGTVAEEKEDIPKGSHHSFSLHEGDEITIIKKEWLSYQLSKIKDACETKISKTMICVFDRESAFFALLKRSGYEFLSDLKGEVQKKNFEVRSENFYIVIIKQIEEYDKRFKLENIIVASPAFWKEELLKELKNPELRKKIILATCSSSGKEAFNEVLKRKEVETVLLNDRISKEMKVVDLILEEISKKGKAAYGFKEVKNSVESGAAQMVAVTEKLIKSKRESDNPADFKELENIMKTAEKLKGEVHIINSSNEAGKRLDSLGGIAALLRYKLEY